MIKVYQVNWKIPNGGPLSHLGIVCGGHHYRTDKYGTDIIPATSIKMAETMIQEARPSAIITGTKVLADLTE